MKSIECHHPTNEVLEFYYCTVLKYMMPGEVVMLLLSSKTATVVLKNSYCVEDITEQLKYTEGAKVPNTFQNTAYKNNSCTVNPFSGVWCQNPGSISTRLRKVVLYLHGTKDEITYLFRWYASIPLDANKSRLNCPLICRTNPQCYQLLESVGKLDTGP